MQPGELSKASIMNGVHIFLHSIRLKQIDDQLSTLAKSKNHTDHFRWALQRMKKTAVFDIERVWLSLVHGEQS